MEDVTGKAFNEEGLMTYPELHDGYLTGLTLAGLTLGNEMLTLAFKAFSGEAKVVLFGLERLLVKDFREGNIVFDAGIAKSVKEVQQLLLELLQCSDQQHVAYRENVSRKVLEGEQILFYVSSSYGASVISLAKRIQVLS